MSDDLAIGPVGEEHLDELADVLTIAFGPVPSGDVPALRERLIRRLPELVGRYQGGRLASVAAMRPLRAWIGGVQHPVGGLANVATFPWARRRGHVVALLRHWLERLHEDGVGWCAEHPFDPRFYARYGFQSLPNGQVVEVPPALFGTGAPSDAEALAPDRLEALRPIHAAFARRYGLALTREGGSGDAWHNLVRPHWGPPRHVYLLEDAYLVFRLADDATAMLYAHDYAFATPAGRQRLWELLASFRGQTQRVRIHLPPGDRMLADTQPRHGVRSPLVQLRVVDLAAALAPLRSPRPSRWTLAVRDEVCRWNDGTFEVAVTPDGCSVTPGSGTPAASLDVQTLAALLGQASTPEIVLADGRASGDVEALRALSDLTRGQPTFHAEADDF